MTTLSKKICMVGDFGVGKTSLIRRYVENAFSDQYLSTVGVKISRKTLELEREKPPTPVALQLMIWDLEGHTRFKSIAPSYLQGAKGALVVADVTRPETIDRLTEHIDLFGSVNPEGRTIVALNKSDLLPREKTEALLQQVSGLEIDRLLSVHLTSAKTGDCVNLIFEKLARHLL
ncbi:MAG TPA: GTP-binding protein [Oscillatoriales cyanobacterium M59_W2019_021]|nr:GTP-binding protein [Oscillatoriales cyanobacterium M4454_W2019_049]HIK52631.1 GTP-binding protein [Oscillatoriales cyanobacterium M59_W2019_021]